jgi:hypothetical protein
MKSNAHKRRKTAKRLKILCQELREIIRDGELSSKMVNDLQKELRELSELADRTKTRARVSKPPFKRCENESSG